jgi:predicted phosphodiesterase
MRIALFSDVHSNLPGLEAVLADIAAVGVDARYALGDMVGYAPWPNEVLERLQADRIPVVMGNYDDGTGYDRDECGCAYVDPTGTALGDQSFGWTKAHTTAANKGWLRSLPREIRFEADGYRFLLVHGSPPPDQRVPLRRQARRHLRPHRRRRRRGRHRLWSYPSAVHEGCRGHALHQRWVGGQTKGRRSPRVLGTRRDHVRRHSVRLPPRRLRRRGSGTSDRSV